jgi:hypothetical protein
VTGPEGGHAARAAPARDRAPGVGQRDGQQAPPAKEPAHHRAHGHAEVLGGIAVELPQIDERITLA